MVQVKRLKNNKLHQGFSNNIEQHVILVLVQERLLINNALFVKEIE